ncbi:MAG: sodium/proline symporter [Chitinispirillaceae bacterium]|nr:sodium/proline symporter [Chitinispirillaceae bacterium]
MDVYEKLRDPVALTIFILTLLFPLAIGLYALFKTRNQADFFVGGRAMGRFVVALSAVSSGRSSWLVLGVSGMAYSLGLGAVWAIVGYITVEALQFIYIGKRLRNETQATGAITLLDYFESRFRDTRNLIRITGVFIITIFIIAYVAAQFNAGAKTLSTALNIPFVSSLIISGLLILIYMVLGGFVAVSYNDVVRAVIMLLGLVILPIVGVMKLGGPGVVAGMVDGMKPGYFNPFSLGAGMMLGFVGIGLGSPGQPHIVVRYMSINNARNLTHSAVIGTFWNIMLGMGALCIGIIGRIAVPDLAHLPDNDPEMVYLVLSSQYFGPIMYGILVGGIFAAILSTADSQLLVVASTFVRDLYEKVIRKEGVLEEKQKLLLSRIVVVLSGIVALILASAAKDLVFWLVLFAWGGLGASFGPALILSLYWKRTRKVGIVTGMISGTLIVIVWKLWLKESTGVYELIPAFFGALCMIIIVSLLRKEKIDASSPS